MLSPPLGAWNFYFQNCLSFLAWAKPPIINWGYLFIQVFFNWVHLSLRGFWKFV
jgi:hypothetical protein